MIYRLGVSHEEIFKGLKGENLNIVGLTAVNLGGINLNGHWRRKNDNSGGGGGEGGVHIHIFVFTDLKNN